MTACGAIGALMVGGRVVGELRCEKDAGHADGVFPRIVDRGYLDGGIAPVVYQFAPTPHSMTLTWAPEGEPDLDLFDPDESFDVVVDL